MTLPSLVQSSSAAERPPGRPCSTISSRARASAANRTPTSISARTWRPRAVLGRAARRSSAASNGTARPWFWTASDTRLRTSSMVSSRRHASTTARDNGAQRRPDGSRTGRRRASTGRSTTTRQVLLAPGVWHQHLDRARAGHRTRGGAGAEAWTTAGTVGRAGWFVNPYSRKASQPGEDVVRPCVRQGGEQLCTRRRPSRVHEDDSRQCPLPGARGLDPGHHRRQRHARGNQFTVGRHSLATGAEHHGSALTTDSSTEGVGGGPVHTCEGGAPAPRMRERRPARGWRDVGGSLCTRRTGRRETDGQKHRRVGRSPSRNRLHGGAHWRHVPPLGAPGPAHRRLCRHAWCVLRILFRHEQRPDGRRDRGPVQSVDRALTVLSLLAANGEMGVTELSRRSSASTSRRPSGWCRPWRRTTSSSRSVDRGKFRLGVGVLRLAGATAVRLDLVQESPSCRRPARPDRRRDRQRRGAVRPRGALPRPGQWPLVARRCATGRVSASRCMRPATARSCSPSGRPACSPSSARRCPVHGRARSPTRACRGPSWRTCAGPGLGPGGRRARGWSDRRRRADRRLRSGTVVASLSASGPTFRLPAERLPDVAATGRRGCARGLAPSRLARRPQRSPPRASGDRQVPSVLPLRFVTVRHAAGRAVRRSSGSGARSRSRPIEPTMRTRCARRA